MAQHDYVIDNASGATVRADINSALSAIQTLNSGTSEPSSTAAGMLWLDTTGGAPYVLKVRDAGNNHWLTFGNVTDPGADGNLELLPGKISLPSSGGIYESDGSTQVLTESGGSVTIENATFNGTIGTSASGFGLITHADSWRYTANVTSAGFVTANNWERIDSDGFTQIGTGVSVSSGVFTFPEDGIWWISTSAQFKSTSGGIVYIGLEIYTTIDNSNYNIATQYLNSSYGGNVYASSTAQLLFRCTDTTTHKIKFNINSSSSNLQMQGSTSDNKTSVIFLRVGNA